jgi:UDP-4-amino-4,6-dideoxy-N-acetyl-beta-L-altrosamine transaminase
MAAFLPYGRQTIEDDDVAEVAAALRAEMLTTGPLVDAFERDFAAASGARHAIACNSGTAALHLAALALRLGPGDAAIVPSITFVATANAVRFTGAEVVFADVDSDTGLMDAAHLDAALARMNGMRPRAIFPVHLNGQLCDMAAIAACARHHELTIVEDACHALGVEAIGAATHGGIACFSTHPVKAIATGEGGVVTTGDAELAQRMRALRSHGLTRVPEAFEDREAGFDGNDPNPWYYEMPELGWNYRLPDLLCALGISQLRKLARFRARRLAIAALYDRLLAPLAPAIRPVPHDRAHGWHLYAVLIDVKALGTTRARVIAALREQGIGTQVHYIPVHRQPYYRRRYATPALPGADAYYARCLSIPFYPSLHDDDVARVSAALARIAGKG